MASLHPQPSPLEVSENESLDHLRGRVLEHDLLRVFVAVVDSGGYTAAGQLLHRTQAAISQQIRRLEEAVRAPLFEHPRRMVRLTSQGRILLEYARRLIALNDEALASLRSDEVAGRVRIGANNHYATHILPKLLADFSRRHPGVQVELHTGVAADMQERLGGSYDILINVHPAGLGSGVLLRREQLHWVTSHADSPDQSDPLPVAFLPQGSLLRSMAVASLGRAGRSWRVVQESSNIASLMAAVASGWAVSVFQRSSIDPIQMRVLGEADGMPALPMIDVRLEVAQRYLSRAAVELHRFLMAALKPPE
jgi:DNA-binding transcriptional LysR family regulator